MAPRKQWDKERMKSATNAVRRKEMGSFKASRVFNVPQTTLERYVKISLSDKLSVRPIGRQPTLPKLIEEDLAKYCTIMENTFYGLPTKDVRIMAYQLASRNGIKHRFSQSSEQAGRKWLKHFFRRNPKLSVREPQGLSFSRAKGFNPEDVSKIFDLYEPCLQKIKNNPSRLYNCDETGITIVQHKHTKVVALKGKKQVASLQSAERGSLMTIVTCTSPSGHYIPPMIVFPRKNMKPELMNGTPPGSIHAFHPSGWIQSHIFTDWLRHFISHIKPTEDDPVVLVLDGHFTHTRNIDAINIARENHVIIVCLPPHSSHKLQPLDVAFMKPFKTFYKQEVEMWLRGHIGRVVTVYQIGELFGKAYIKAANAQSAANGFEKTGLYPLNRFVFGLQDFPLHPQHEGNSNEVTETSAVGNVEKSVNNKEFSNIDSSSGTRASVPARLQNYLGPSTSSGERQIPVGLSDNRKTPETSSAGKGNRVTREIEGQIVKASHISPIPALTIKLNKNPRTGSAEIITSSPYKKLVEEEKEKKRQKEIKKLERENNVKGKREKRGRKKIEGQKKGKELKKPKKKMVSRKLLTSSSSESEDEDIIYNDDSADDCRLFSDEENDAECLYCTGLYSEDHNGEDWVRCTACFRWSHTNCADFGSAVFVCVFCAKNKNILKLL